MMAKFLPPRTGEIKKKKQQVLAINSASEVSPEDCFTSLTLNYFQTKEISMHMHMLNMHSLAT